MLKKSLILMLISLLFLTGCSTKNEIKENIKEETIEKTSEKENKKAIKENKISIDEGMLIEDVPNIDPNFTIEIDSSGIDDGMIIEEDTCTEELEVEIHRHEVIKAYKPVIYLYPEKETLVDITLDLDGVLTTSYPTYKNGWKVLAFPNGKLIDQNTINYNYNEYPYLFWEADLNANYDLSKGFVVEGTKTKEFLQEKLSSMGLNYKECADFITYWVPKMEQNSWNLITFQQEEYTNLAKLNISPTPDTLIRIFMVYKPLDKPIEIEEPILNLNIERKGFIVIEWGGTEV